MLETLLCILTLSLVCPKDDKPANKPVVMQMNPENAVEVPEPIMGVVIGSGLFVIALKR